MIHKVVLPVPYDTGTVNVYLMVGEVMTLVDTGVKSEGSWNVFQTEIKRLGYTIEDIKQVILTHHHVDHVGALDYFSDKVEIIGHKENDKWISQDIAFLKQYKEETHRLSEEFGIPELFRNKGFDLSRTLRYSCKRHLTGGIGEGDTLPGFPEFTVLELPGHASTHLGFYREKDGLLIGGDVLLAKISSNPLIEPRQEHQIERTSALLQYNNSLQRIATMNINRIMTGHGEDVTDVKALVQSRLHKQQSRAERVLTLIEEHGNTVFELTKALFQGIYEKQLFLTISETLGQLDYLEYNGKVYVEKEVSPHRYYVKR